MSRWHDLKTDPAPFEAVRCQIKTVEIRRSDRDFRIGDLLILREHLTNGYSGRIAVRAISHVLPGGQYGLEQGFAALSLRIPTATELEQSLCEFWTREHPQRPVCRAS